MRLKLLLVIGACCTMFAIYKYLILVQSKNTINDVGVTSTFKYPKKYILSWTTFFNEPMTGNHLWSCPELNCEITTDRRLLKSSSALIFHVADIKWNDLPAFRDTSQYYAFLSHESPLSTAHVNLDGGGKGFFNLSLTYRRDSDLYFPYSAFRRREKILDVDDGYLNELIKNRTKLVAWMVSNCHTPSKRESYVAELRKYINVDVYGKCGTLTCSHSESCDEMMRQNYKFYLAFENSNCADYVTEKFIVKANRQQIVPVVMMKRNYIGYAPNMSYISVEDFSTPKTLADYLYFLDKNPQEYKKYLVWRSEFETGACTNGQYCGFCKLCNMIQSGNLTQKIVPSMNEWWFNSTGCDNDLVPRLLKTS